MTLFSLEAMIKKLSTQAATSERTVLELQKELATVRDERDAVESENKDCKRAIKELSAQARLENVALADKEKVTYERRRRCVFVMSPLERQPYFLKAVVT